MKNQRACDLAREAASRLHTTQDEAIERALTALLDREAEQPASRESEIRQAVRLLQEIFTEEQREALRAIDNEVYDERGLPR
ncbi:MAG: type II toxin-antitoxin system VapB family antitoxin [Propionibacteriaceae bacterium]|nr:type II toxin-antitoxin system VapB family antitoxin [Propionibacteriaceae bacterium]